MGLRFFHFQINPSVYIEIIVAVGIFVVDYKTKIAGRSYAASGDFTRGKVKKLVALT